MVAVLKNNNFNVERLSLVEMSFKRQSFIQFDKLKRLST